MGLKFFLLEFYPDQTVSILVWGGGEVGGPSTETFSDAEDGAYGVADTDCYFAEEFDCVC